MSGMDAIKRLPPLPGTGPVQPVSRPVTAGKTAQTGFGELLDATLSQAESLNFSAHAQSRLLSRSINLTGEQMARLQNGVSQAAQKGARESLVMMDNLAFIVSVTNRTVVTAVDKAASSGNVFTQIDSAVIV
jgi:flagellar operon protein